ncbi:MAG: Ig domain-containing protein, partial [Clostridia bacterium]|nr:Ig domain-containing protein [Clostridia bacterium]
MKQTMQTKLAKIVFTALLAVIMALATVFAVLPTINLTASAGEASPYADLENTTTVITFDGKDWYLIDYDSTTVTLLSEECVGVSKFSDNDNNTYSGSTVESFVNSWYTNNISADAKAAVNGNGMFLLTTAQAKAMTTDQRKCSPVSGADFDRWWLCSPGGKRKAARVNCEDGTVDDNGNFVSFKYGVRPALKLDLSKVTFDSEAKTFSITASADGEYTITVEQPMDDGGTIDADVAKAASGATVTLSALPSSGMGLYEWKVTDDGNNPVTVANDGTFTMPQSNVKVTATFREVDHIDECLMGAAINGKAIGDNDFGLLLNEWFVSISDVYVTAPTVTFVKETDVYFVGETDPKATTTNIDIVATEVKGSWSAQATIQDIDYMIRIAMPKTVDLSTLTESYEAQNGDILTGEFGGESQPYKITVADGATVTLKDVDIDGMFYNGNKTASWAGINCEGNATIILEGNNSVTGFYQDYPAIYIPTGKTLTIKGSGSLDAKTTGKGAGIGGGRGLSCGNIVIEGGTITAQGGDRSAGIGSGKDATCGDITIKNTVTRVTTTMGGAAIYNIGAGDANDCGTITIGGKVIEIGVLESPYTYEYTEYYLWGTITETDWDYSDHSYLLSETETEGVYSITDVSLGANDAFKVLGSNGNVYPDGMENEYSVETAGIYNIYFRPAGDGAATDGWHKGYIKVEAASAIDVTGVNLDQTTVTMKVGETVTLTATVLPENATFKNVTWSSSSSVLATVVDGVVTAKGVGTVTITAKATNGTDDTADDKTVTCKITILKLASVKKAPKAKSLSYTGSAQELLTAGTALNGTMQYALGTNETATGDYSATIPTATAVGTYYVWYKVVGDETHSDTAPKCITVTLSKATPSAPKGLTADYGDDLDDVALPEGWAWVDGTQTLVLGLNTAKANFTPEDTENYNAVSNVDVKVEVIKIVKFNGIEWYVIKDDSTAVNAGSITLLAKEPIAASKFNEEKDGFAYSNSLIRTYLDGLTKEGGAFADVEHAIKSVDLADVNVTGAKLYLLSKTEANTMFATEIGKCTQYKDATVSYWWLRTPIEAAASYLPFVYGVSTANVIVSGGLVTDLASVRPALQLDLARVMLDGDTYCPVPDDATAKYGNTLNDVELDAGWSWKEPALSVGNVGINEFTAIYTTGEGNDKTEVEYILRVTVQPNDKTKLIKGIDSASEYYDSIKTK